MSGQADGPVVRQVTEDLVLIEVAGRRILAEAHCPHRRGLLRFGHVDGRTLRIRCPLHQSTFDIRDGRRLAGPRCDPLRIVVDLSEADAEKTGADAAVVPVGQKGRP
ncbi:Rieske (2Fe-2S) protein [Thermobifida halotolerans]|uniref:Rieske (2Fe-2S) protein n=1 Tax=Thermobifida halotolerans TaxID=483545 RepID=A0AA97LV03_9ACTN|nr:Rieske (2Fe-2S) protein [Thermobifida halotolerans]UOE18564.1 Rieske (2Fe-2S) protein [Thermobifida halotolerans]